MKTALSLACERLNTLGVSYPGDDYARKFVNNRWVIVTKIVGDWHFSTMAPPETPWQRTLFLLEQEEKKQKNKENT